jgi:hypothetical protein
MFGLTNSYTAEHKLVNPVEDSYSWLTNSRVKTKNLVNPEKLPDANHCPTWVCRGFKPFDYLVRREFSYPTFGGVG